MSEHSNNEDNGPVNRNVIPDFILEDYFVRSEDDPTYDSAARLVAPDGNFTYEQFDTVDRVYQEMRRAQSAMMYLRDMHGTNANDLYQPAADFFAKRIDEILHPQDPPLHDK